MEDHSLMALSTQMTYVRRDIEAQREALREISSSLRKLTEVEIYQRQILEQLSEGRTAVSDLDERLQVVERSMPGLAETRRWVVGGVMAGVSMMAAALIQLTVIAPLQHEQQKQELRRYAPPEAK